MTEIIAKNRALPAVDTPSDYDTKIAALNPRFEAVLRECLAGQIPPDAPLDESTDLSNFGVDSLAVVRLLVTLEDTFEVSIPHEAIAFQLFASPKALWGVISGLLEHAGQN